MLSIVLSLLLMSDAQAQEPTAAPAAAPTAAPSAAPAKSKTSTAIFEQEPEPEKKTAGESITAKVKVVREDSDGVEVFFEGPKNTGTFYLRRSVENYATHLKNLEASKKPQGPAVTVTYVGDKVIKSVEKPQAIEQKTKADGTWEFSTGSGQ